MTLIPPELQGPIFVAHEHVSVWSALRQLFDFMPAGRRKQFYFVLSLLMLGAFAELLAIGAVLPFLSLLADPTKIERIPWIMSLFEAAGADSREERLLAATILFGAAAVTAGAVRLQLAWSSQKFVFELGHDVSVEIQRRILSQPYSYHISHNTSEIVSSLQKVHVLVFDVLLQLLQAATAAFISVFIVVALIQVDPFTAIVSAIAFGAMYGCVSVFTKGRLTTNSRVIGTAYADRVQIVQESLGGIRDVIIDGSEAIYLETFRRADLRLSVSKRQTAFIGAAPRFVIEAAGMVLIAALALVMSAREGGFAGALPILGALALGAQRLLPMVQQIYYGWTALAGNRSVVGQVLSLLELPAPEPRSDPVPVLPLPFQNSIEVQDVRFFYPDRQEPALDRIKLTIPRGARIALVGRTGSGKSTLADLLMGLLEPTEGQVTVDGVPLAEEARRRWQRSIAHVPQAIFLADSTIERNIAFGVRPKDIDRELVRKAARQAQLHEFIATLSEGYETPVGERGVRLSGGQRQRLGIARAIYKQAPVLVLDEATSALDDATEASVMEAMDELGAQGLTIIMIAHRLSTVASCDVVARLENGRIVALGSYAEIVGGIPAHQLAD
ncbi:MAG TPA: ABC transporter ATP-binding protein [Allosphingosinicella sp.]|jgi:ABC-type multidrug transport system fused ATPase/permease subunit